MKKYCYLIYCQSFTVKVQVYDNITAGIAKRILRNHHIKWNPTRCGVGLNKLKDKKYLKGGCSILYNPKRKRLTIRVPYSKVGLINKEGEQYA